jgi:SAM-dependent methyltransferase
MYNLSLETNLICPKCKADLTVRNEIYCCDNCNRSYKKDGSIINFLTRELPDEFKKEIEWYSPNEQIVFNTYGSKSHELAHILARNKIKNTLLKLGAGNDSNVLCIAVGSGEEIPYIMNITKNIYGIDISKDILEETTLKYNIKAYQAEADALPFKSGVFDFVIVSAFIHHIAYLKNGEQYFSEFNRVLKLGGAIIVIEPNLFYPLNIFILPARILLEKICPGSWGGVDSEFPLTPFYLLSSIKKYFTNVSWNGCTFTHNRIPFFINKFIERTIDKLRESPLKIFSWWIIYCAKKTNLEP